jgi:heptosyltransferase-2
MECAHYQKGSPRILILKVGLAGEVLRCTPILRRLRELHPHADITWVTDFPDFVPKRWVTRILRHSWQTTVRLQQEDFDIVYSLDKDFDICAIADTIRTKKLYGFKLSREGKIIPASKSAELKWLTGIWDDLMLQNKIHYPAEIFEICDFEWKGERYILEDIGPSLPHNSGKRRIGLNTGASNVWRTRIWPDECWQELAILLRASGYDVLFLGGPNEHEKNQSLARYSGGRYQGVVPYKEFFALVASVDLLVTSVTMAMHVAIALEIPVILLNNIFNKNEFHLYGQGEVIEPAVPCLGCYKTEFDAHCPVSNCTLLIKPKTVMNAITKWGKILNEDAEIEKNTITSP